MRTSLLMDKLQTALAANLNPRIVIEATVASKTIAPILVFSQGFEDPMRLTKYNTCLICQDQVFKERAQALTRSTVDVVLAISGKDKDIVTSTMQVYVDALANLVDTDPTIGGNAFEARFEFADFMGPAPGNGMIGVVIARLAVYADDLLV